MAADDLGRRERKKLTTHRALRHAALSLVAERGIGRVTVEDIAEAADVSTRTFYDHFTSKEDAVIGIETERTELLREALIARPEGEAPLESLHAVLRDFASSILEEGEEWQLRMKIVKADPALVPRLLGAFASYERVMVEVIADRTGTDPDGDLYPVLTATVATSVFRTVLAFWRASNGTLSLIDQLDVAFAQLGSGLRPPKADGAAERKRGR